MSIFIMIGSVDSLCDHEITTDAFPSGPTDE